MHSVSAFTPQQQQHRRGLSLSSSIVSDRDDDLSLFREMQRREQEREVCIPEEHEMTPRSHPLHNIPASFMPVNGSAPNDLLCSDLDKTEYNWLMTPPSTPLLLPVNGDPIRSGVSRVGAASVHSTLKTSKLGNPKSEPSSRAEHRSKNIRGNLGLQQPLNVNSTCSSSSMSAKSLLYGVPRSSTHSLNLAARSTPSSTHMVKHAPLGATCSSRPSSTLVNGGPSQETMQNGGVHTVAPSAQATIPYCKSVCSSRPSTPVKRAPSPIHPCNPPTTLVRCSSANRASSMLSKGTTFSRPCSPTSKAWFPEAVHGFFQERPPNLRTSMPERFLSRVSTSKTCQGERCDTGVQRRGQSSSSVVGRRLSSQSEGKVVAHTNRESDGSAAEMLVKAGREKKPTMCSQEGQSSVSDHRHVQKSVKSSPLRDVKSIFSSMRESSILGKSLSKKSLDPTSRSMDKSKGTPQKLRSFVSTMSKGRGPGRQGGIWSGSNGTHTSSSVMDSPMATSSCTSSEHNMSIVIDPEGSELGDESISETASQHDLFLSGKEKRISSWLRSPYYRDDDADIMQIFEQEGLESLSGPESPLITDLDGTIECDSFSLEPI